MKFNNTRVWFFSLVVLSALLIFGSGIASAATGEEIENVQKYYRALHIMVMLLAGFGFLMAYVRGYGRSALTATFLLVSVAIPLYFLFSDLRAPAGSDVDIDTLILAEFAAASLLICAGAVLGRLKMHQYLFLGMLFIPFYMLNEWIVLEGGFGIVNHGFADTGGSIVIHAFGALFGLGVILTMTTKKEFKTEIKTDATSDRFSLLGSMLLWVFWPSFCAALVPTADVPWVAMNVVLALCGSTLATYAGTIALRRAIGIADIANAALAGGVAIGATCDHVGPSGAIMIGMAAGLLSTIGFAFVQSRLQSKTRAIDTCGVLNLHGFPGLMGGLLTVFVVSGISVGNQLTGIGITVVIALLAGILTGLLLSLLGRREKPYEDSEEILEAMEEEHNS